MVRLSVNVNKVATLRNSRGGSVPSVVEAVGVVLAAGARGITVHPRADERHITARDVRDLAALLAPRRGDVEFNIEGDPRPDLLALVHEVRPHQCTLVPVKAGEITSQAGWPPDTPKPALASAIAALRRDGVRVSLFVDPDLAAIALARDLGADRVEIYTEPFARAFERGPADDRAPRSRRVPPRHGRRTAWDSASTPATTSTWTNLPLFRTLPHLDEVSIGHALISRALYVGLDTAVREYLAAVEVAG